MEDYLENRFRMGPRVQLAVLSGVVVLVFLLNAAAGFMLIWLALPLTLLLAFKARQRYLVWLGELAPLLKMGHTLPQALVMVGDRPRFSWVKTNRLVKELENGTGFARACYKRMPAMPGLLRRVLEQGEKTGCLPEFIGAYYDYDLKRLALMRSTGDALSYGFILFTVYVLVFMVLMIFVVPVFGSIYEQGGLSFPWTMDKLMAASVFLKQYWPYLVIILIVVPAALARLITGRGLFYGLRQKRDTFLMLLFARAVINTGGQPEEAVLIACRVKGTKSFILAAEDLIRKSNNGVPLATNLIMEKALPPDFVSALASSIMAGRLPENLDMFDLAFQEQYGLEAAVGLDRMYLAALLINGLLIGYLLLSIYMSIFNLGLVVT